MVTRFDDWEGEYLQHFGVLGMKWYVHKNPQLAYDKASAKRRKLDQKVTSAMARSVAANSKLVKAKQKAERNLSAAEKYTRKAAKTGDDQKKAQKEAAAEKHQAKYEKVQAAIRKYELRASKADLKRDKATLKGKQWCEAMLRTFNESSMEALERKYNRK